MLEKVSLGIILLLSVLYDHQKVNSFGTISYIYRKISNCDILPTYIHSLIIENVIDPNNCLYECQKNLNCHLVVFKMKTCYVIELDYNYLVNSSHSEVWQKSNSNGK